MRHPLRVCLQEWRSLVADRARRESAAHSLRELIGEEEEVGEEEEEEEEEEVGEMSSWASLA